MSVSPTSSSTEWIPPGELLLLVNAPPDTQKLTLLCLSLKNLVTVNAPGAALWLPYVPVPANPKA